MLTAKPRTANCVIDGATVTLTFFPDTGILRITDSAGARLRETRWPMCWRSLLRTFREFSETRI